MPNQKGFTLIEILITMAITSILFTIGYTSFRDYTLEQALVSVTRTLNSDVQSAQAAALAGNKPGSCGVLTRYNFVVASTTSYNVTAVCSTGNYLVKSVTLPADSQISSTLNTISFKPLAQGTNIPSGSTVVISITQISTGRTRSVTVRSNGNID